MTIKELAFILLTRAIKERVDTVDLKAINELTLEQLQYGSRGH